MSDENLEKPETVKEQDVHQEHENLPRPAIHSIQGVETPKENINNKKTSELKFTDPNLQAEMEEWKRSHDPANWEYRLGSPHADYQLGKDLDFAKRQHEIGIQATTADGLGDAIDTTIKVKKDSKEQEETPGDVYFREKYGPKPYTTDAYPKEEE